MSYKESSLGHNRVEDKQEPLSKEHSPIPYAATIAVVNADGQVLLQKHRDRGVWSFPRGIVGHQEAVIDAGRRGVRESTGVDLRSNRVFPLANYGTATEHEVMAHIARYDLSHALFSSDLVGWFDPQDAIDKTESGSMTISPSDMSLIQRTKEYLSDTHQRVYGEVFVGGTFDRLHPGHKQLLYRAFAAGDYVYIGIATDEHVGRSTKHLKHAVQPYAQRRDNLQRYIEA